MSYGVDAPFGLQPRFYKGTKWDGQVSTYLINGNVGGAGTSYATSIFKGDLVKLAVDGTIQRCAAGDAAIGVFWGCQYFDSTNTFIPSNYWKASNLTYNSSNPTAFVIDSPDVIFDIQAKGTGAVTGNVNTINQGLNANAGYQSDLNYNYNIAVGTGNTLSGYSGAYLDLSTQAVTATLQLKLIGLTPVPGNNFGVTFNNGLVKINNHTLQGGTGTVGI
jgi:hypothetical protein